MENGKSERLAELVRNFAGKRIAVAGDLMLDIYTWGKVSRISPEAPVPIVRTMRTTFCLGGAANVMRNIVSLGGKVFAFGVAGADHTGEKLGELLAGSGIDSSGIVIDPTRPTIRKQRIIAGAQQLLRIDDELLAPVSEAVRKEVFGNLEKTLASGSVDALILEDYAKGLFSEELAQELIDFANSRHILVAFDPNPKNPMRLKGLSIMKPNRNEAYELASMKLNGDTAEKSELKTVAAAIRKEWNVRYLLISLAEQGMALFAPDGNMTLIPTRAKEVYDVSGAGDTVIAASTLALSVDPGDPASAAEIANYAAGIVVGKLGTAAVSAEELIHAFSENGRLSGTAAVQQE